MRGAEADSGGDASTRKRIVGVVPGSALRSRAKLFGALERAFPVSFEGRGENEPNGLDGAIVFGQSSPAVDGLDVPLLVCGLNGDSPQSRNGVVTLADSHALDARLRRRELRVDAVPPLEPISIPQTAERLADLGGQPIWIKTTPGGLGRDVVALFPPELDEGESLRDLLSPGRFPGLLPVVHFLRELTGYSEVERPSLRASFVFDDPNLHSARYGFIEYRRLVAHAREHGYHVAMATVPLDGWFARDPAVRLFREETSSVSLVIHGNNHSRAELRSSREALLPMLAQALRRAQVMGKRLGIDIGRVMVPPYEVWSDDVPEALAVLGYEALCTGNRPAGLAGDVLRSWGIADLTPAGLPVLDRQLFDHPGLEHVLLVSAYLDQPLIVFGHHGDVRGGYDVLARTAELVGRLGKAAWMSPSAISRGNFTIQRGAVSTLTLLSSRVRVSSDLAADRFVVRIPADLGRSEADTLVVDGRSVPLRRSAAGLVSEPVSPALEPFDVSIHRADGVDPRSVPRPARTVHPVARRLLTEARDRFEPVLWSVRTRLRRPDPPHADTTSAVREKRA